jgi:hypothetical protein
MRPDQFFIALDQTLNTTIGTDAWADETFSSRCWRNRAKPVWEKWRKRVDALFFWQHDHCRKSYESEMLRRQLPVEFRTPLVKGQPCRHSSTT